MWLQSRVALLSIFLLAACATAPSDEGTTHDSERISRQELEGTHATDLYELIERQRPRWLISRGARSLRLPTEIIVAVDGRYYGEVHTLRQFRPEDVMQVRYVDSATATATVRGIGSRHVEAAILVEMRRTRSPGTDGGA